MGNDDTVGTPAQESARIASATGKLGILTVVSRILGLFRDIAQAALLGTGYAADAFSIAFIIPNILRRFFGESTISAAFVPTYTETLVTTDRKTSNDLASRIFTFTGIILLGIVIIGIILAPLLVRLFAPGFADIPGKSELTAGLLRLLFPYIFFVGLAAIVMGILNSHRHFTTPAFGPILLNISALIGIFLVARYFFPDTPVWGYAIGISFGGVLQLVIQLPKLRRKALIRPLLGITDPRFRRVVRLMVPALIALVAAEINIMIDQIIASFLEPGSVSALLYGGRINQFPQGIFAVALATALLPTLSRQTAVGKLVEARETLRQATLGLGIIMIPATIFMVILSKPIVTIVLARGAFTSNSTALTSAALMFYALGLMFWAGVRITAPVFFAMKDTKTPVKIAVSCMGLNILLNIGLTYCFISTGLAKPLAGLALASSISGLLNFILLKKALYRKIGKGKGFSRKILFSLFIASSIFIAIIILGKPLVEIRIGVSFLAAAGSMVILAAVAFSAYMLTLWFSGNKEIKTLLLVIKNARRG